MKYIITAIVFISMAIIFVFSPSQLFSRHDPIMIRLFNANPSYKGFLKYFGYLLFGIGASFVLVGIYKIAF